MNRSIFLKNNKTDCTNVSNLFLNFGPQHPAAHGVLRLVLTLKNEYISSIDTHIGLLHRGTEKLFEKKKYLQNLPFFDRFDYVSMMIQEHAYCLAIEKILGKNYFLQYFNLVRTLYDELTRVLNHLLALACHALDVGSMSPIFWGFEEREKIMEFYERVSGARMHAAFYRPGQIFLKTLPYFLLTDICFFLPQAMQTINEIHLLLVNNKIWKQRLVNVGQYSIFTAQKYSLTGVMLRSCGVSYDIRISKQKTYANYKFLSFSSYTSTNGDSYDRYLLRIYEILESLQIANQLITVLYYKKSSKHKII